MYTTKDDLAEVKSFLNNKTRLETHQQKVDITDQLITATSDVVEVLKRDVTLDLTRIRRAFYKEKSILKLEIENLKSTVNNIDKTYKDFMQAIKEDFQNISRGMSLEQVKSLQELRDSFGLDMSLIDKNVNKTMSSMIISFRDAMLDFQNLSMETALRQENNLKDLRDSFASEMSLIDGNVNKTMFSLIESLRDLMQNIEHTVDNKLNETVASVSMCKEVKNTIDDHENKQKEEYSRRHKELVHNITQVGYSCSARGDIIIRLANGNWTETSAFGRLEVRYDGIWGTVCGDSFSNESALVACRMLGYLNGKAHCCAAAGQGANAIMLDDVICTGQELTIFDCSHKPIPKHNCGHHEDVAVTCYK